MNDILTEEQFENHAWNFRRNLNEYSLIVLKAHDAALRAELAAKDAELARLKSLMAKSDLIEVEATRVDYDGGSPVIVNDGTTLVKRNYIEEGEKNIQLLQKMAGMAREIARLTTDATLMVKIFQYFKDNCYEMKCPVRQSCDGGENCFQILSGYFDDDCPCVPAIKEKE